MPNRTATFVSAIVASLLAAAPFSTVSRGATPAADTCLANPKNQAPEGSHWFYRVEHPSNRHCWYLKGEQSAASSASASARSNSDKSASPNPAAAMPGSVANARAELSSPQTHSDQDANLVTGQPPAAAAGSLAIADNPPPAKVQDATMRRSVVASRWPDQLAANATTVSTPSTDDSSGNASSIGTTNPPSNAVAPLAAADAPSAKPSSSTQMLIIVIVGALSVAGLAVSAVGFGSRRKTRVNPAEGARRAIWETTLTDSPLPSPFPTASRSQLGLPRELHEADDPDDKIAQMLVRLARSAQA